MLEYKHLIIRAELDNCPDNPEWVHEWLVELVETIGMNILDGPHVKRVDTVIGNIGCTGVALGTMSAIIAGVVVIETSHVSVHFWEETNLMQFDIFTCGEMNLELIWPLLECMQPSKIQWKLLDREKGLETVAHNL